MDVTKYLSRMILAIRELPPPHIDGGTEPGTGENPDDTWTEITSLDGLEGTWESQYVEIERAPNGENVLIPFTKKYVYPVSNVNLGIENGVKIVEIQDLTEIVRYFTATEDVTESFAWNKIKEGYQGESFEFTDSAPYEVKKTYYRNSIFTENRVVYVNQSEVRVKITEKNTNLYLPPTQLDGELNRVDNEVEWEQYKEYRTPLPEGDKKVTFSVGAPYTEITTSIFHKTNESTNPGENPDSGTNPGTGTEPGAGEKPNDTWTKITSLDGLEGTWKCAYRDFRGTSNDNIYELVNTTEFILFNETGDVSVSYMTDHTQEVKELSLADNRPENEIWKEIQNICTENPSDFSYEFTQSEPYISKSFGTIPRFGEQGFETLLIGDGTNSCTYINESKTQLKMVSILESTIYVSETESQRPIKDDTEWEQYKAQQAPFLPEGDMFVTYSKGETYLETYTQILHKQ